MQHAKMATASQISSLQRQRPFFADSLLTPGSTFEMPQAAGLGALAATSLQTRSSPAIGNPTLKLYSAGLTALIATVSVLLLCARR